MFGRVIADEFAFPTSNLLCLLSGWGWGRKNPKTHTAPPPIFGTVDALNVASIGTKDPLPKLPSCTMIRSILYLHLSKKAFEQKTGVKEDTGFYGFVVGGCLLALQGRPPLDRWAANRRTCRPSTLRGARHLGGAGGPGVDIFLFGYVRYVARPPSIGLLPFLFWGRVPLLK